MIAPQNYFTFDSVSSSSFNVYTNGAKTFSGAEADLVSNTVPGKSGDLIRFNNRYANITISYDCWLIQNMRSTLRNLRSFLLSRTSYKRLEDTYHPDEFRLAVYTGGIEPEIFDENNAAIFTLSFNCKPQRFLKSGETKTTCTDSSVSLSNPTYFAAKPLIRIYGNGVLTIGSKTITVSNNANTYVDYDSELMDAYTGSTNRNADVVTSGNDFITLPPGSTTISKSNTITKFEVTPRWYAL